MTAPQPVPFSAALEPFPVTDRLPGLPTPRDVKTALTEQFNAAVARERDRRGEVQRPADVWPMVRAVEGFADLVEDYGRVLSSVAKESRKVLEEELVEAVGESDGIPVDRLVVPAGGGQSLHVKAKTSNEYDIDTDQVIGALVALVATQWERDPDQILNPERHPEAFAVEVGRRVLGLFGSSPLKVTQVRGLATELGQAGEAELSQVVTDAVRKRVLYRGVAVERRDDPTPRTSRRAS